MTSDRPSSAPGDLLAAWRARRDLLAYDLDKNPEASSAWWWRIHLRICTYLLRRYQDSAPPAPPADAAASAPDVERAADIAATTTLSTDQLGFREEARGRIRPFLAAQRDTGRFVREHASIVAERERQRQLRYDRRVRRVERYAWGPAILLVVVCASPLVFILQQALWSVILRSRDDWWIGLSVLCIAIGIIGFGVAGAAWAMKRETPRV